MLLRRTVGSHLHGANGLPGTVVPIRLCNVPTGVSRVVSVTNHCNVPMLRSTTRTLNSRLGKQGYNAFNRLTTLSFGNGGVVAASNKKTLVYHARRRTQRAGFCTARTHSTTPRCRRARVNCGCHVDGVYTNVNHKRVFILSRRVTHHHTVRSLCISLLGSITNVAIVRGPSSQFTSGF